MRKILVSMAVLLSSVYLTSVGAQTIEISNMDQAIEEASQQTILTQRIMKDYGLVLLGVKASKYQKELTDSINRYETIIAELKSFPPAVEIAEDLMAKANKQWQVVKKIAQAQPTLQRVAPLQAALDHLLETDEEIVNLLAEAANNEDAPLIALGERQAMLSQRVAALYMLHALGVEEENFTENMQNASFEFKLGQEELAGADINDKKINKLLKKVKTQFKMLEFSVNKKGKTFFPFVVSQAAEKIYNEMLEVGHHYVELYGNNS